MKKLVTLTSVSPIAFTLAKVGDLVEVKKKLPKANEFRGEKIGAATISFLIFKGITKIGMLPEKFVEEEGFDTIKRRCRIKTMEVKLQLIEVEF
jgi:hypothetical protein